MNLYLTGYRGTGKTTLGRALALTWGVPHLDLDAEIQAGLPPGTSIADVFREQGEAYFRELEAAALQQVSELSGHVISLGGGAVLRPENRRLIQATGRTLWLRATPLALQGRLGEDAETPAQRPRLTAAPSLAEEIETVLAARTPLYREVADREVETDPHSIASLVELLSDERKWLQPNASTHQDEV